MPQCRSGSFWDGGVGDQNHVAIAMPMYFKLSARELEILEDRETILKKLAENQVSLASMVRVWEELRAGYTVCKTGRSLDIFYKTSYMSMDNV